MRAGAVEGPHRSFFAIRERLHKAMAKWLQEVRRGEDSGQGTDSAPSSLGLDCDDVSALKAAFGWPSYSVFTARNDYSIDQAGLPARPRRRAGNSSCCLRASRHHSRSQGRVARRAISSLIVKASLWGAAGARIAASRSSYASLWRSLATTFCPAPALPPASAPPPVAPRASDWLDARGPTAQQGRRG